ncbi:MAG: MFS transporter [Synergistaceae bacterium]|nr:MFS transporter [Synergistaceae bacterium]MBP9957168.1 MFS transporter [Synergistaceae bacterium]
MSESQFSLLKTRRFLPFFLTQFLGAFNDNLFKSALVMLVTFSLARKMGINGQVAVTVIAGLFILPFFLFSSVAGELADRYEKAFLIRRIKFIEIILMALTAAAFYFSNFWLLVALLFLMGAQSTFFGPLKYSIIPEHLEEGELIAGNALVSAGTYLAILIGTIVGGLLILQPGGVEIISVLIVFFALLGWLASLKIPNAGSFNPKVSIDFNIIRSTHRIIASVIQEKDVFLSILGVSWFWFVGATFLSQFPSYTKDVLQANEQVATLFLTVFSIGVGLGSLLCNTLLKGEIDGKYVPYGAATLSVGSICLWLASRRLAPAGMDEELFGILLFLQKPEGIFILISLLAIAIGGGIYVVPLNAIMQTRCKAQHRARVIACSNIMNSFMMVLSAVGISILLLMGFTIPHIFLVVAVLNCFSIWVVFRLVHKQRNIRMGRSA